jgi:hypothetical protein
VFSGCVIEDPPPYVEPTRTPPRLDLRDANPPIGEILNVDRNDQVPFSIPVFSEDAGVPVAGLLHLDFDPSRPLDSFQTIGRLEPSTLDDQNRPELKFTWQVRQTTPGCHRLTLFVAHDDNIDYENQIPVDTDDQARAVWWANVDAEIPNTLVDCPSATSVDE